MQSFEKLKPGQAFGAYQIVTPLGEDMFSAIYLAQPLAAPEQRVVIKLGSSSEHDALQRREALLREAQLLVRCIHPHVLPLLATGEEQGCPYLVVAYAANGSLRQHINAFAPARVSHREALTLIQQIGEAVAYLHEQHIIHCDLKPENILLNEQGAVWLADFGLARPVTTGRNDGIQRRPGGSLHYMAPEVFQGVVSAASDQYALGCIAYELLTGQRPLSGLSIREIMRKHIQEMPSAPSALIPSLPPALDQVILRALAKRPEERYSDVAAFVAALQACQPVSVDGHVKEEWQAEGARLYVEQRYTEALEAYEAAFRCDEQDADTCVACALVLSKLGKHEGALRMLAYALELAPGDSYVQVCRGYVFLQMERYAEAQAAYNVALILDPTNSEALVGHELAMQHRR